MKHSKVLLIAIGFILCLCSGVARAAHPGRIHYIDVGQAESILLEFDKAAVLIDAGGEQTNDAQQRTHLTNYLNTFFQGRTDLNRTIDTIIISHPHIDHSMMLMDVMQSFTVKNLIDGGQNVGSGIQPLTAARAWVNSHGGHSFTVTRADTIQPSFFNPALKSIHNGESDVDFKLLGGANGCTNANNDSIVVVLTYKTSKFIFTGDAEDKPDPTCHSGEIQDLLQRYAGTNTLRADVYKVDHHGSANGTDANWIQAISPKISVISAGKNDPLHRVPGQFHAWQFGHPRESAVKIIEQFTSQTRTQKTVTTMDGVKQVHNNRNIAKAVYCTCWDGDIVIDGSTLQVRTAH